MNLLIDAAARLIDPIADQLGLFPRSTLSYRNVPTRVRAYAWGKTIKYNGRAASGTPGRIELIDTEAYKRSTGTGVIWCWDWVGDPSYVLARDLSKYLEVAKYRTRIIARPDHVRTIGDKIKLVDKYVGVGFYWTPTTAQLSDQPKRGPK